MKILGKYIGIYCKMILCYSSAGGLPLVGLFCQLESITEILQMFKISRKIN